MHFIQDRLQYPLIEPYVKCSPIKCDGTHFMSYVAARFMCRPAFTTVRMSEPVDLDTT